MKYCFILIFIFLSLASYSQPKIEFGITTEGSWFMPQRSDGVDWDTKAGFGTGIGIYASQNIFWRFSADIGLAYRYKQMKQHWAVYSEVDKNYTKTAEGWDKLPMHYIVIPVHLQLLASRYFFIRGGIEATWLTNYDTVNEKPEYNWILGFGSQKHKLKWSINYIKGFKDQGFSNWNPETNGQSDGSINRNYMLQLNLSYPIWQKK